MTPDFRAERMESAEGLGNAHSSWKRAWDAYAKAVNKRVAPKVAPVLEPALRKLVVGNTLPDIFGFWLIWHLEGGFEGLERLGMSRATIYRKVSKFRQLVGKHPDEYELPGVTIDLAEYVRASEASRSKS